MVFTPSERRLLALLVFLLGLGYVLTAARRCGGIGRADGEAVVAPDSSALAPAPAAAETLAPAPGADSAAPAVPTPFVDGYLDLNAADSLALLALPGIGPAYASRILAYRRAHAGFASVEELLQVKGIGRKRLERLRGFVAVRGAAAR